MERPLSVAIIPQTRVLGQPNPAIHTEQPMNSLGVTFVLLLVVGMIASYFIQTKKYKTQHQKPSTELLQKVELLEKVWKVNSESCQTRKQIETLERIWHKTP
jgi:hypothetical protein